MPVPSTLADLSVTAALNSPPGSESIGTNLDDYLRSIQAIIKQGASRGADIAAASTLNIPANGSYFVVTGTTTINAIADSWNGRIVVLRFSDALQLTHSSGLILPGSANITTAAGDVIAFVNESVGVWRYVFQQKANVTNYGSITTSGLTQSSGKLLGRTSSGTGAVEEISVGSRLVLSNGVLDVSEPAVGPATESIAGIVELATAAEAQALASAVVALTPARLADAFKGANQSLTGSGYQKLPGGLIIQWGVTASINANASLAVTFPISFPNAVFAIVPCGIHTLREVDGGSATVSGVSTSGFTMNNGLDTARPYYYIAIGL